MQELEIQEKEKELILIPKKIQQFDCYTFSYERLFQNNFDLTISYEQAKKNLEICQLADSEVLRKIRILINHPYNEKYLKKIIERKNKLIKKNRNDIENKELKNIFNEIKKQTFIPQYICVQTLIKKDYKFLGKNGFKINGIEYCRLLCSAGHARTNRTYFIDKSLYNKINEILKCGVDLKSFEITPAKYNAYYSLLSSATQVVDFPRMCVVEDKEIKMTKKVDWITEIEGREQDTIEECDKELDFNLFDGMGIVSPDFAKKWQETLNCDYLPSAFCIRSAFIKGMVGVFDFHKFYQELVDKEKCKGIIDIYGKLHNPFDIDLILTKSQFKLWNAYKDFDNYLENIKKYNISFGITKYTPKEEKNYTRTNYQFLQVLNLNDKQIENLCQKTVSWIKGCGGEDINKVLLYLIGKNINKDTPINVFNSIQDNYVKSLMLEPNLIKDTYIVNRIVNSLNKKVKDSYIGSLLVDGNFQVILSDPYALCEHIFGIEMKGLLKENEHFSKYWNDKNINQVAGLRSPLTWRSEINILNLKNTLEMQKWYQYLDNAIILNIWGSDFMIFADADVDGDIIFTTSCKEIIQGASKTLIPITYEKKKAPKKKIKEKNLYLTDYQSYSTKVGYITNLSTTLYEMQSLYKENSIEWNEIELRLKLCRKLQGNTIDNAKGIKTKPEPKFWKSYTSLSRINEEIDKKINSLDKNKKNYEQDIQDLEKARKDLLSLAPLKNKLRIEKRPYFMRYRYPKYNLEYKKFLSDFDKYAITITGLDYKTLATSNNSDFDELKKYFYFKNPLLETNGTMNRICYHMEKELKEFRKNKSKKYDEEIYSLLFNREIPFEEKNLEKVIECYNEYNSFKNNIGNGEIDYNNVDHFYKELRIKCLEKTKLSLRELSNYAVFICYNLYSHKTKDFVWDIFGSGIVEYLKEKNKVFEVPMLDSNGDIEYLYQNYSIKVGEIINDNI